MSVLKFMRCILITRGNAGSRLCSDVGSPVVIDHGKDPFKQPGTSC